MSDMVIGRDAVTGVLITLGDLERRRGVYVLGRSGTGKSTLLMSLLLQELQGSKTEGTRRCRKSSSAEMPSRIN
jgi:ABC-type lipoprotein export system ATPase subunit